MKTLNNYIFESLEILTSSNKERKKELEKWLRHKKYEDYVDTLNQMLDDPKSAALLKDGFGGELGDTKLKFSIKNIPVSQLMPTQKEIDLDKSIKYALNDEKSFKDTFKEPIKIKKPIITFRQNYIIDGHHSWLQAIMINPEGKMLAFNYDGDISPIQMLKAVQGTIAAVKAEDNNNNGKLPSNTIEGPNIFDNDFNRKKIRKYLEDNFDDSLVDIYCKYIKECRDKNDIIKYLEGRLLDIKANNYPLESAPERADMPQVFKAGTNKNDKSSAYPDREGSALNKLKDDKFIKSIVK
ncbi:hypothetical protein IKN40_05020 [bacterium]|nr:hypothetical protein [bacterium]